MDTLIILFVIALFVSEGLFVWWLANRRQKGKQRIATAPETVISTLAARSALTRVWRAARSLLLVSALPLILLFFFAFFVKTTSEYACAIQTAQRSSQVVAVIGEPVTPGLFAWTPYFESGGGLEQGLFFTTLSGPDGSGTLRTEFYRSPIGATLYMVFKAGGEDLVVYDGEYPCH